MEDFRPAMDYDQDDWTTDAEYLAFPNEWARMGIDIEILNLFCPYGDSEYYSRNN